MQTTLVVKGITDGQNEATVRGALEALQGVQGTEVHLATEKVDIMFDEGQITVSDLKTTIENQGYMVIV
ncbi:cation transporter [Virgibacillus sp. W0181]|uniref:cation transporter n=1 Tax=Virgibacillus sp. W0181 TaxID=3391581 RepID=UPI003F450284